MWAGLVHDGALDRVSREDACILDAMSTIGVAVNDNETRTSPSSFPRIGISWPPACFRTRPAARLFSVYKPCFFSCSIGGRSTFASQNLSVPHQQHMS